MLDPEADNRDILMLSILIPTIQERTGIFRTLMKKLRAQDAQIREMHWTLGDIEIIWDKSKKFLDGGPSIGEKRGNLVKRARGKYLCFLDDDEDISPRYLEALLRLTQEDKDVCTFRNISKFDNYWCMVDLSIHNPNEQTRSNELVLRKPWHICPVRSEFAKQVEFPKINYGEDWQWFDKVLAMCRTEAKTKEVLHEYRHSNKSSAADKIIHHEQEQTVRR